MSRFFWLVLALLVALPQVAQAGPPPMDPKRMSGIPRVDPQVPVGTLTVRCLGEGGFQDPAVGVEVELKIVSQDGSKKDTRTAKTVEQGRATFDGLSAYVGGRAIASATLGGKVVSSQPIAIDGNAGSRVMLVLGASAAGTRAPEHGQPGGPAVPPPGTAFPLTGTPIGDLTIGTFDLNAKQPIPNSTIKLTITPPEGEPLVREGTTDQRGKLVFKALVEPDVAPGSKLVVEAALGGDPSETKTSEPFKMSGTAGMAVVLARGGENITAQPAQQQPQQRPQRAQVPGPRTVKSLPEGTVRVKVVDANDQPVAAQPVTVVKKTAGGGSESFKGETGRDGVALVKGVGAQLDAFFFVEARYDRGPYQSPFFQMDRRGGVAVDLRVYETTADFSVVRSALQWDFREAENDHAAVYQILEVMVQGEKAFWPDGGLEIGGLPDLKSMDVLRPAERWLDHDEKAPFAKLSGPIPPGELANLSVGYIVEHNGTIDVSWASPFEVIQTSVLVGEDLELKVEPTPEKADDKGGPNPEEPREMYLLGERAAGETVEFQMTGFVRSDPTYRYLGGAGGILMLILVVVAIVAQPRGTLRERTIARRDELLTMLASLQPDSPTRPKIVTALDRIFRQLRALDEVEGAKAPPASPTKKKKKKKKSKAKT